MGRAIRISPDLVSSRDKGDRTLGTVVLVALLLPGCVAVRDSVLGPIWPQKQADPLKVAVLPPRIAARLRPENLQPESRWYERLLDGRGAVVTTAEPETDVQLGVVTALTCARKYARVFPVDSMDRARELLADQVLLTTVHDCRAIIRGANGRYPLTLVLSPFFLFPQFWIRWLTVEARIDWEVTMLDTRTGQRTYHRRLQRSYYKTIPYGLPRYLTRSLLGFLLYEASPEYVCELMLVDMLPVPAAPDD